MKKYKKGFTLIEAVIGIIVIAIVVIGAFEFFRYCQKYVVDSEIRFLSINFARETMEAIYWNDSLGDTGGWQPVGLPSDEPWNYLQENFSGNREYRVYNATNGEYRIMKSKVEWNF